MKIVSWNVNSIKARLENALQWVEANNPDILMLQELKCEEYAFPYDAFSHLSYNYAISGQKTYNGVAILSKYPIDEIKTALPNSPCPDQARFIEISCNTPLGYMRAINVYVPNGGEVGSDKFDLKMNFLPALKNYLKSIQNYAENIVIGGDFNVAPFDIDVYDSSTLAHSTCFTLQERKLMREILNEWHDLYRVINPLSNEYSWWDYRAGGFQKNHGMRIDFLLGNAKLVDITLSAIIDKNVRAQEKASDHAPVVITLRSTV
jgi:exodeoxyribonuclease-3